MRLFVFLSSLFLAVALFTRVSGRKKLISMYGETIKVPCNDSDNKPADLMFTKWKYLNQDGTSVDLLVKQPQKDEPKITAPDTYMNRISIEPDSSLLISSGRLIDQRVFTCIVVTMGNLMEYPVEVEVHKRPAAPEIKNKASRLEDGKLTKLGECVAANANPPAEITWVKNNKTLVADNKTAIITNSTTSDQATGLSTSTSILQYMAGKQDMTSVFACVVKHATGPDQITASEIFNIHYPTENVTLQVHPDSIMEGDNVTLTCHADGNPLPTNFNFYIKGKKVTVTNSNVFTLPSVTRADSGEYKCTLLDNDNMGASRAVTITYLDLAVSPTGKVQKKVGDSLEVKIEKKSSGNATVLWTKDNGILDKLPDFSSLTYNHAGLYVCEVTTAELKRSASFQLVVEGSPVIKSLKEELSSNGKEKVISCEVEGSPEPDVQWSVNGTQNKGSYINGVITHQLTIAPSTNLTVTCRVSNDLGSDSKDIEVSSVFKEKTNPIKDNEDDKVKVIAGVVVGLLLAALVVAIVYGIYMRRRQGSWKTGEKEMGDSEESKKLEENNHRQDP